MSLALFLHSRASLTNKPIIRVDRIHDHHHWSVWITADFLDVCQRMQWKVVESQDKDDKVGNGFTVIIQKDGSSMQKCWKKDS